MKLSAYRESLLRLTDQVLADYELQVLLQPTDTSSPYYNQGLRSFAEVVFNGINSPQILTASSIGGTPVPGLTDLDTLPGQNRFEGDVAAPPLRPAPPEDELVAKGGDFTLPSGLRTDGLTREQLLSLLTACLNGTTIR